MEIKEGILVFFITGTVLFVLYADHFSNLNNYFFGVSEDGLKNYYSVITHVKYDSTYFWSVGMNYPYGEHVVFTDAQPLISNTLKFISSHIRDISDYTVGIMNFLMLSSIAFSSLFLYLIFRSFKIPRWISLIGSLGISFMSPQLVNFGGALALSYAFIIPALIWLLRSYYLKQELYKSWVICLFVLCISFLHFYYFAFAAGLIFLMHTIYFAQDCSRKNFKTYAVLIITQVIIPFLLLQGLMYFTDPVNDRPESPNGMLRYIAHPASIFLPPGFPLHKYLPGIHSFPKGAYVTYAYVGLVSTLVTTAMIVFFISKTVRKQWKKARSVIPDSFLFNLFISASILLLLSFGLPFTLIGEDLIEYLGVLKQIRAFHRFSWIFYYAINIISIVLVYSLVCKYINRSWHKSIVMLIPLSILLLQAHAIHSKIVSKTKNVISEWSELVSGKYPEWVNAVSRDKFQGILPLPYFLVGPENIRLPQSTEVLKETFMANLYTGIPIVATHSSRTSLNQSLKHLQFVLDPYKEYELLKDLPNEKPLMTLLFKNQDIAVAQQHIWDHSRVFYEDDQLAMGEIAIDAFPEMLRSRHRHIQNAFSDSALFEENGFLTNNQEGEVIYYDCDSLRSSTSYRGSGAIQKFMSNHVILFEGQLKDQHELTYEFSMWTFIRKDDYPKIALNVAETLPNGDYVAYHSFWFDHLLKAIDGDWGLITFEVQAKYKQSNFIFMVRRPSFRDRVVYYDEILIRPVNRHVYKDLGNAIFMDNRSYPKNQ